MKLWKPPRPALIMPGLVPGLPFVAESGPVSALLTGESATIGNATDGGGLAAMRDGFTSKAIGACAQTNDLNTTYWGVDWGAANDKTITRFLLYGPNTAHGINYNASDPNGTVTFQGSTDNFSSSEVDLYDNALIDTSDPDAIEDISSGITITTAYRYHRVRMVTIGSNYTTSIAELQLYGY